MPRVIRLAHSPDSDDAFMFAGLSSGAVSDPELEFVHELGDIESLNRSALTGSYELTALSVHAYPHLCDRYDLMDVGASVGDGYGPLVVSREPLRLEDLAERRVAIPGRWTTAALTMALAQPRHEPEVVAFDAIPDAVASGRVDAGVLIHEGQLTFERHGLHKVADLGVWWQQRTGLPLPLGANGVRRDLGAELASRLTRLLRDSIQWGLDNRAKALAIAGRYARDLKPEEIDRFVGMYVNEWTLSFGERGRRAVAELLEQASAAGLVPAVEINWVMPAD